MAVTSRLPDAVCRMPFIAASRLARSSAADQSSALWTATCAWAANSRARWTSSSRQAGWPGPSRNRVRVPSTPSGPTSGRTMRRRTGPGGAPGAPSPSELKTTTSPLSAARPVRPSPKGMRGASSCSPPWANTGVTTRAAASARPITSAVNGTRRCSCAAMRLKTSARSRPLFSAVATSRSASGRPPGPPGGWSAGSSPPVTSGIERNSPSFVLPEVWRAGHNAFMIVDCAVYKDGKRRPGELPFDEAFEAGREPDAFVWIGLYEPSREEFAAVAREFNLHELAVEDAIQAHQRARWRAPADGAPSRPAALRTGRGPARDRRPGGRRLLPGHARPRRRHQGVREGGLLGGGRGRLARPSAPAPPSRAARHQPGRAHLQAQARGDRAAPGHRAAGRAARPAGAAAPARDPPGPGGVLPRRRGPPAAGGRRGRRLPRPADQRARREPGADRRAPERGHAQDLRLGGDRGRADHGRRHLRHELRPHAGAALAARLPHGAGGDGRRLLRPVAGVPAQRLAVAGGRRHTRFATPPAGQRVAPSSRDMPRATAATCIARPARGSRLGVRTRSAAPTTPTDPASSPEAWNTGAPTAAMPTSNSSRSIAQDWLRTLRSSRAMASGRTMVAGVNCSRWLYMATVDLGV